jgi:CRISPR-associated endonuclease Csn1
MRTETVWAFDLGKGSIGEAVRRGTNFLHKASLLIPADFAETKTAAGRRRMWRTRQAHKAREQWLNEVMRKAGIEVLQGRRLEYVDYKTKTVKKRVKGKWKPKTVKYGGKWKVTSGDCRLEREFGKGDNSPCYTSCLLRIKLLQWKEGDPKLEPWQVYKALHSAIQRRGYDPDIPWKNKEAARQGLTPKELEDKEKAELLKKDPGYQAAVNAWKDFKVTLPAQFHFPAYYDAAKMGLWDSNTKSFIANPVPHEARSTRKVRFDREDINREIIELGNQAASQLPKIREVFEQITRDGWLVTDEVSGMDETGRKYRGERVRRLKVLANSIGEFLCHGPGGQPYAAYDPSTVEELEIEVVKHPDAKQVGKKKSLRRGTDLDWLGVTGQKIPRFDNRIIEKCALIPALNVCRAAAKPANDGTAQPDPDTLLHTEVAFLMKLKNIRVLRGGKVEALAVEQIRELYRQSKDALSKATKKIQRDDPKYAEKVASVFAYKPTAWANVGDKPDFNFKPYANHEEIEAPKCGGRSRFSRTALKILRELILRGEAPSAFRERLIGRDEELLQKLGTRAEQDGEFVIKPLAIFDASQDNKENAANRLKGLLVSDLEFLKKMQKAEAMQDSWDDIFIPNEKLDGLVMELQSETDIAKQRRKRAEAIRKLIGSQNDPIVRHRLKFFWEQLQALEALPGEDGQPIGEPSRIILEFAREDFLGKKAKDRWQKFNKAKREQNENVSKMAASENQELRIKLWQDQGGECVYGKPVTKDAECIYTQRALPQPGTEAFDELEIDHIVPRIMGGPNAYINYVLTFREVANQQKRDRIPYVWFSQDRPNQLDAYIKFVQSKKEALGRKKVALLSRPDAAELVEKYTALAQTAWISRLAQTIIRLHFGWPLDHQKGQERVLTLTGGQTAQFRREFRLNSLLGPNARTDATAADISKKEEEAIEIQIQNDLMKEMTKNRVDPRHHALDAMALTLIPEWRHYETKKWAKWRGQFLDEQRRKEILERPTPFFDDHLESKNGKEFLNKNSVRQVFAKMLGETHAELVAFERPALEETHYDRTIQQFDKIESRPLDEIAFKSPNDPAQRLFDQEKLRRWLKRCRKDDQKEAIESFANSTPSQEAWEEFKRTNKRLFPGGKVKVLAPEGIPQYTVRKELRLLAYESDQSKTEKMFKPEWARADAEQIRAAIPVMQQIKTDIEDYLKANAEPNGTAFAEWLKTRCKQLAVTRIALQPLADESEEADSRRRGESRTPENFGCRNLPLVFKPERILKTYVKICDPLIRQAIAIEFNIEGEGKKAKCRAFSREEWEAFCQNLRKPTKKGIPGPRVLKVTLTAGESDDETEEMLDDPASGSPTSRDEFVQSRKSPGAFMKGAAHKGYYLYVDASGHWRRLPVFVHQSQLQARKQFAELKTREQAVPDSKFREIGFLHTGCRVELKTAAKQGEKVVAPAGLYRMNTLMHTGRMELTGQNGAKFGASVNVFIAAGLSVVEKKAANK